jgi:deoxyribodipyrimidine photo-lyase
MIQDARLRRLNDREPDPRRGFVLYWMQAAMRETDNHALEHAVDLADELRKPLVVVFGLMDDYPEANARHYAMLLEGLRDVDAALRERGIPFVVRHGSPETVAIDAAKEAAAVVCDRAYTRHQKAWRVSLARACDVRLDQVETDAVVPVETAASGRVIGARVLRPRIHRVWEAYLVPLKRRAVRRTLAKAPLASDFDVTRPAEVLKRLKLDRSVPPVRRFVGGEAEALRKLGEFLKRRLPRYADARNEPADAHSTRLSPYLHFGQISPLTIALAVRDAPAPAVDRDACLEELIVRRELSFNFVHYCEEYDRYESVPAWGRQTLEQHAADARPYLYSDDELEGSKTHDPYWNAAMSEMRVSGFMANYMRMYWGKKILEWSPSPREGFERTLRINNKYFLDGRDPNSFCNVAWVYGLHDRPWGPKRPIFGTVRYMNDKGLARKFDMDRYVRGVETLMKEGT